MLRNIETAEELRQLAITSANVLVYFYNDGCAPCISLRPKVEQLMLENFPKMDLVYVNGAGFPELVAEFQAFSFPVLIIFFEGKEFRRYSKYVSISELSETIGRIYNIFYGDQVS